MKKNVFLIVGLILLHSISILPTQIDDSCLAWSNFLQQHSWKDLIQDIKPMSCGCGQVYALPNYLDRAGENFSIADMSGLAYSEPHFHSPGVTEVYFMLHGSGIVVVGYDEFVCTAGDIIVIPPMTVHYVIADKECVLAVVSVPPVENKDYHVVTDTDDTVKFNQERFNELTELKKTEN